MTLKTFLTNEKWTQQTSLLIDADLYLFRALIATEEEVEWTTDCWSLYSDVAAAKASFNAQISHWKQKWEVESVVMCLTGHNNFRRTLCPDYKSHRKKSRKPLGYTAFVEWCKESYAYCCEPTLEADDIMGILATAPGSNTIIVSDDKDMLTIPANLYRPQREELGSSSKELADRTWLFQTLVGDSADGFPGLPRVGPVTAEKILGRDGGWPQVVQAFQKGGFSADDALLQARLARILRYNDWDNAMSEVRLWEPS
tara:strand:- start:2483 stop:3250 length:768 start_codon:yes stop_codon:yes gene_type:complete